MIPRPLIALCLAALGFPSLFLDPVTAGEKASSPDVGQICRLHAREAEKRYQLPKLVLSAISLAESGRWHSTKLMSYPWPWTVTSGANSNYYADKSTAIEAVNALKARGVRNIDVGCMQINLHYHPDAFANLSEAFDPIANTDYAAKFLKDLFRSSHSWNRAIGRYHSATPTRAAAYLKRVNALWRDERVLSARLRREAVKAAYREREQARKAARFEPPGRADG
ncbi:transglycosylase SLT domain-containing protein [bacterium]|nr:transglycosylase SLT domain-containing protein [bacterium]